MNAKPANKEVDFSDPDLYLNRELSHLQFNFRVLSQTQDTSYPLLERLNFLLIFSANLDEFFEIRVADIKQRIAYGQMESGVDGLTPKETLTKISEFCKRSMEQVYHIFNHVLIPELKKENIRFLRRKDWSEEQEAWAIQYFKKQILPVVSPLGLDPAHPFPRLVNKSLNFIVSLEGKDAFGRDSGMAIVPAPRSLPRLIRMPKELCKDSDHFVFLSSLIHANIDMLFSGMTINGCYQFRLTRNSDLAIADDSDDLAIALKGSLFSRRFGSAVRLEIDDHCPEKLTSFLLKKFNLTQDELYKVPGPVNLARLRSLYSLIERPDLLHKPIHPQLPDKLLPEKNIFHTINEGDILLLHPFQSFRPVIEFLRQASEDPDVLAIKQTLYRTGSKSEIVDSLVQAAKNGKEVTVSIEIRARFDEEENLNLSKRLQDAGAIIVYGLVDFKTHAKMALVVRKENDRLKRYVHLGTGNYHPGNAQLYTDYSFLSSDPELAEDVNKVFQQLTGMGKVLRYKSILQSPFTLSKKLLELIGNETKFAQEGKASHIIIKANSLTEPSIIQALYLASQAGVKVDLIIRGICCLKPGISGISEHIRVRSIVGRFLEHSRVYYFQNIEDPILYCGSADLMERNLFHRVETCFPIKDKDMINRIYHESLQNYMSDNTHGWALKADGNYEKTHSKSVAPKSAQNILLEKYCDL